jgi:hypothetical protein
VVESNLLIFPDMDRVARKYLLAGLAGQGITGIPVATRIPSPMPDWFIRCFALPGAEVCPRTQWVQVIVMVYGTDDEYTSTLARTCAAVMRAAKSCNLYPSRSRRTARFPAATPTSPTVPCSR